MNRKLTLLQNEQIELGRKHGLQEKQIRLYAKPSYNFLQMQELRTAMENGITGRNLRFLLKPSLSHQEMSRIRRCLEQGQQPLIPYPYGKILTAAAAVLMGLGIVALEAVHDRPYLLLNRESVTLKQGDVFDASSYIERDDNRAGKLILPVDVDTSEPGRKAAVYRYVTDEGEIVRILYVDVHA